MIVILIWNANIGQSRPILEEYILLSEFVSRLRKLGFFKKVNALWSVKAI